MSQPESRLSRGTALSAWILIAIAVFYFSTMRDGHRWGDDFAQYMLHARNLGEGREYAEVGYIYNRDHSVYAPRTYPPLLPVFLAPVYLFFDGDVQVMKGVMIVHFLLFLFAFRLFFRSRLPGWRLDALLVLVGFNYYFWDYKDAVRATYLYGFLAYLTLWLMESLDGSPWRRGVLLGVCLYLAYAARSAGLTLIGCLLLRDLISSRRVSRSSWTAVALAGFLIGLQGLWSHSDSDYLVLVSQITPGRLLLNAVTYIWSLATLWQSGYSNLLPWVLYIAVGALAVVGFVKTVRTRVTVAELFLVLHFCVVLLIPATQAPRYVTPLIPLYLYYALKATVGWEARGKLARASLVTLAIAIGVAYLGAHLRGDYMAGPKGGRENWWRLTHHQLTSGISDGIDEDHYQKLCEFIRAETSEGSRFLFRRPRCLTLMTGRAAGLCYRRASEVLWKFASENGITHLIVASNVPTGGFRADESVLKPLVEKHASRLEEVYANPRFRVYRIR